MKQIILIADDNALNRQFLASLLEGSGFATLEASDGAEALELARQAPPALIIADIVMPNLDGYQLVKEVRTDPALAQTPIIFYTANYIETEARQLAEACGVSSLLVMPAEPEEILSHVHAALAQPVAQALPPVPADFEREHRQILTNKLSQKVDELGALNETLERQLKELALAEESARLANHSKDLFIATLSHELRTPLTPVLALVSYLSKQSGSLPAELRKEMEMIRRNVELEAHLIDDLLDVTRISNGKMELALEVIDAHATIHDAFAICAEDIRTKNLSANLELQASDHRVWADPVRLHQAFWNILNNAVKFTPPGGQITIRSHNGAQSKFVLEIEDTGIGFEPETLEHMFDAFDQGNRTVTRQFGGLGLGLAITKGLVEAHHGTLEATSPGRNRGASFKLTLKSAPVGASSTAVNPQSPYQGAGLRILFVDDHDDTRRVVGNLLRARGHEVFTAPSVAGAIEALGNEAIDVLLSDLGLPDGTGYELMERAKALQPLTGVALSGYGMAEDIARALESGFSHHFIKPLNFEQLDAILRQITPKDIFKRASSRTPAPATYHEVSNVRANQGSNTVS